MKRQHLLSVVGALLTMGALGAICTPAYAALPKYDVPEITCGDVIAGALIELNVCAGPTGALAGLTIQWKTKEQHDLTGWDDTGLCELSLSGQPSLQHPGKSAWELDPNECETILIGDINFDETGVSGGGCGLDPLEQLTTYVFRWFAHAGRGMGRSDWGGKLECTTGPKCTQTFGYWMNNGGPDPGGTANCSGVPSAPSPLWPESVMLTGMPLGNLNYGAGQLCTILWTPAAGRGHRALAHQLIAARLNLGAGSRSCPALEAALACADAFIGNTNLLGPLPIIAAPACINDLIAYNAGGLCPGACVPSPYRAVESGKAKPGTTTSWGNVKSIYR